MDYEKKYKEALEWARKVMQGKVGFVLDEVLEKFPELKESEGERIRKEILSLIQYTKGRRIGYEPRIHQDKMIAWLEKQGKNNMGISEATKQELEDNLNKALEKETPESCNEFLEKQGEQKPVPKFKVGDTMRTLQEATNGYTDGMPVVVSIDEEYYHCNNELIAIKDQDDYEYPPMNRRQKPADLPKGEDYGIDSLYHAARILEKTLGEVDGYESDDGILEHKCAIEAVNRLYKQKPAWSEEDEEMFDAVISDLERHGGKEGSCYSAEINWLKSLKERVQPQQQEWSEEDKRKLDRIYFILRQASDTHAFSTTCRLIGDKECVELQDFLKSLKERYTWKPSDEQIIALDSAIHCYAGVSPTNNREVYALEIMKEQLKKLMEK